ncbi:MAG: hypothetical protein H0X39_19655 [Actinobacteria bacterium]|nr:hypothetical protein [Actinomycetota bacterium]
MRIDERAGSLSRYGGGARIAVEDACGEPSVEQQRQAACEAVRITRARGKGELSHPRADCVLVLDGARVRLRAGR